MKKRFDRSNIIIIVLFIIAGLFSWHLYFKEYIQEDTVNIHVFPNEIQGWVAKEIPISDGDYEILETRNAFTRRYTNAEGKSVVLFIVYSQHNRKVSHPPEICYTGSGATFVSNVPAMIRVDEPPMTVRANKVLVEKGEFQQVMYYWFKVGDTFTSNYWKQQMLIAFKTLLGQPAGSALIRITSDVEQETVEESAQRVESFGRLIIPSLFQYLL